MLSKIVSLALFLAVFPSRALGVQLFNAAQASSLQSVAFTPPPGQYYITNVATGERLQYEPNGNLIYPAHTAGSPATISLHSQVAWVRFEFGGKSKCLSSAWGGGRDTAAVAYQCAVGHEAIPGTLEPTKQWWLLIDINKPHGSTNNKQAITVLFDAQTVSVSTRAKKIANQQKAADQHIQFHKYHGKRDTDLESRASGEADDFYLTDVDDETPLLEFVDDEPESESFSNAEFDDVEPESELEETFNLTGGDVDTEEDFDDTETDKDTEILPLSGSELDNEDTVSVDSGDEEVDTEESATEEGASDIEKRGRHRASAAARARAGAQARARDRAAARARRNHRGGRSHSSGRHSRHSHGRSHGRARHSRSHSRHSSAPSPVVGHGKVLGTFYIIASDHLIDQQAAGLTSSIIMSRGIKTTTLSPLKLGNKLQEWVLTHA